MRQYRIKVVVYKNGRQAFRAQVKWGFIWLDIFSDGEATITVIYKDSESEARENINKHIEGNTVIVRTYYIDYNYLI